MILERGRTRLLVEQRACPTIRPHDWECSILTRRLLCRWPLTRPYPVRLDSSQLRMFLAEGGRVVRPADPTPDRKDT